MSEHPQFAEDIDLLALEMLGDEGRAPLRAHLEECARCRARYEEARSLAALLAFSAPPAEPPESARRNLLAELRTKTRDARDGDGMAAAATAAVAAVAAVRPAAAPDRKSEAQRRPSLWNRANLGWAMAAVLLVAGTTLLMDQHRRTVMEVGALENQLSAKQFELERTKAVLDLLHSSETVRVKLMSETAPWPWPEGKVYYHPRKGLLFVASNLPPLVAGKSYQLWCVPERGAPMSAGIFAPDAHGNAALMKPMYTTPMKPKAFAVTVEPQGGMPAPTGPEVLTGEQ